MSSNPSRSVLITGTSSGIGRAAVKHFSRVGWRVAATMRTPEKERELSQLPGVKLYRLDVTDVTSIEDALAAAKQDFGRLDVLVNNAGYGVDGVFEAMSDDTIRQQFETNVFGLMRTTRAVVPLMRAQGGGCIVQVASMGGRLAFPLFSIYRGARLPGSRQERRLPRSGGRHHRQGRGASRHEDAFPRRSSSPSPAVAQALLA